MKLDRVIAVRTSKTVYRDGDACIKVFGDHYAKSDVLSEAMNQSLIEDLGLPIPRVRAVTMIEGKWAIVADYIQGKTLERLMKEEPARRDEYIAMLVDLQCTIHEKTCPTLVRQRDMLNRHIGLCELDATTRFSLHHRVETMSRRLRVCHGDLDPSNIVMSEDGSLHVLDWSYAVQGDPTADAALTSLLFGLRDSEEAAARYLELFCERSGADSAEIKRWIPVVAAARSTRGNEADRQYLISRVTM